MIAVGKKRGVASLLARNDKVNGGRVSVFTFFAKGGYPPVDGLELRLPVSAEPLRSIARRGPCDVFSRHQSCSQTKVEGIDDAGDLVGSYFDGPGTLLGKACSFLATVQ